ncbi:hypothetical protein C8R42DRAFT_656133 [Lentinula raphanica]|nr:hypothetical protein C8R42DRAFT_656133 [Lentinula raphanica]
MPKLWPSVARASCHKSPKESFGRIHSGVDWTSIKPSLLNRRTSHSGDFPSKSSFAGQKNRDYPANQHTFDLHYPLEYVSEQNAFAGQYSLDFIRFVPRCTDCRWCSYRRECWWYSYFRRKKAHFREKSLNQAYIRGYGDMMGPSYAELEPTADEVCNLSLEMWGEESGTNQRKWQTLNPSGAKGLPKTTLDFEFTGAANSEACPPGAPCTGSRSPNDVWKIESETKKDVLTISIQSATEIVVYRDRKHVGVKNRLANRLTRIAQ